MKLVKTTEHLNVFECGAFHLFERETVERRLFVGFVRDAKKDPKRWPVVTALFSVFDDDVRAWYCLEWLETSRYTGETDSMFRDFGPLKNLLGVTDRDLLRMGRAMDDQVIRDEFMGAIEELYPGFDAAPERQEAADGSVYYLDTLDAELVASEE